MPNRTKDTHRCAFIKGSGERSGRNVNVTHEFCYSHRQEHAQARAEDAAKAARIRHARNKDKRDMLAEFREKTIEIFEDVLTNRVSPSKANSALRALDTYLKFIAAENEQVNFEQIRPQLQVIADSLETGPREHKVGLGLRNR